MHLVRPPYLLKKLYPHGVWRKAVTEKKIYLTFDDGPIPEVTPWVLDILKANAITATFFCVGENVLKYPQLYAQLIKEGHSTGNHTYHHFNGWKTPFTAYMEDVSRCAQLVESKLFRPPYGRITKSQHKELKQKYSIIYWDILTGDYDKRISPQQCLNNAISYLRNGSIIVFHDSLKAKQNLLYALPRFIEFAKQKEFTFEKLKP